jgi:hypothetical protein
MHAERAGVVGPGIATRARCRLAAIRQGMAATRARGGFGSPREPVG